MCGCGNLQCRSYSCNYRQITFVNEKLPYSRVKSHATPFLFLYSQEIRLCSISVLTRITILAILLQFRQMTVRVPIQSQILFLLHKNSQNSQSVLFCVVTTMSRMSLVPFGRTLYAFSNISCVGCKNSVVFEKLTQQSTLPLTMAMKKAHKNDGILYFLTYNSLPYDRTHLNSTADQT